MNSQVLENLSELELIDLCIKKNVWNSMTRLQRRGYIKRIKNLDDASDKQNTVDNETEEVKETEIVKETEQGVSKVKDKKPKINFRQRVATSDSDAEKIQIGFYRSRKSKINTKYPNRPSC